VSFFRTSLRKRIDALYRASALGRPFRFPKVGYAVCSYDPETDMTMLGRTDDETGTFDKEQPMVESRLHPRERPTIMKVVGPIPANPKW
jgi:hypothetical protein